MEIGLAIGVLPRVEHKLARLLVPLILLISAAGANAQQTSRCLREVKTIELPKSVTDASDYRLRYELPRMTIHMRPEDYLAVILASEFAVDPLQAKWYSDGLTFEGTRFLAELDIWPQDGRIHPLLLQFVADLVEMGLAGIVDDSGIALSSVQMQKINGGEWGCGRSRVFRQTGSDAELFGVEDRFD